MDNLLGLNSGFFEEPTVEKWQAVRGVGITEVELGPDWKLAEDLDKYMKQAETGYSILTKAGINISSFHLPFGNPVEISGPGDDRAEKAVAANKRILDWAAEKKIGIAVLHGSFEPIKPEERRDRMNRAVKSIKILGDYAKSKNIVLAIEDLPRTCLGNCADEILELTDNGKNAKVCFDVNHLLIETHKAFFEKTIPCIITTHLSDYDRVDERHWIPGDGCIDWKELIGFFKKAGYSGRFLFETHESAKYSPKLGRFFSPRELVEHFYEAAGLQ
jgi:sugar phosphate isomerase/epimerase